MSPDRAHSIESSYDDSDEESAETKHVNFLTQAQDSSSQRVAPQSACVVHRNSVCQPLRRLLMAIMSTALVAAAVILCWRQASVAPPGSGLALKASVNLASAVLTNLDALPQKASSGKFASDLHEIRRVLEESAGEDLKSLPTAVCVIDVMQAVSMIGQVGNVITAASKDCRISKSMDYIKDNELWIDREFLTEAEKMQALRNLRHVCDVGISSSVALFGFVASVLADAARMCAGSIDPVKVASSPMYAEAGCAQDISLVSSSIAFFASGAQSAALACDPDMPFMEKIDAILLSLNQRRLHELRTLPGLPRDLADPMLGPLGQFLLEHKDKLPGRQAELRKIEQSSCAFDVTGTAAFSAAGGTFAHVAKQECVPKMVQNEDGKMGCSLDVSAVIGSWLSVVAQMGILIAECPPPEETLNTSQLLQGLCSAGVLNLLSASAYMAAGFSDVKRSCGAINPK